MMTVTVGNANATTHLRAKRIKSDVKSPSFQLHIVAARGGIIIVTQINVNDQQVCSNCWLDGRASDVAWRSRAASSGVSQVVEIHSQTAAKPSESRAVGFTV